MARKDRIPVVFDTNLFVARLLKRKKNSINQRTFNLWLVQRRLQLIISRPIVEEYLGVLEMLGADSQNLANLENYLSTANTVTQVNLGKRLFLSRDADDNKFLSTAYIGKAKYVVSRDNDLLDILKTELRGFRFQIVNPFELLEQLDEL
ncbi:MAG: putative toxin-antitoxin system toxin component, PIN family [Aridibacter sp.]